MPRNFVVTVLLFSFLGLSVGCRNNQFCNPYNNNFGTFPGQSTLPAPPTYSLQIPSVSQNQYYNPNATARQPSSLVNPNSAAPTPATLAPQPGWRPVGDPNTSGTQPRSVLQQGNETSATQPKPNRIPANFASSGSTSRTATNTYPSVRTASTSNGVSFKDSVNYRSTQVDERLDQTRLPATDASNVRAPSVVNSGTRLAQLNPAARPQNSVIYSAQPRLAAQPAPTLIAPGFTQTQFNQPAQPTTIVGSVQYGQPGYNVYPQQPFTIPGAVVPSAQPGILAQSTTVYDPGAGNGNTGWRSPELTTRR